MESLVNGMSINAYSFCACDCGERCNSTSARFRPGHDQKVVSRIGYALAEARLVMNQDEINRLVREQDSRYPSLENKIENYAWRLESKWTKQAAKKSKSAAKVMREVAQEIAKATEVTDEFTVKVGRWEYPAKMNNLGLVWRNTTRDGSGEWGRHTEGGRYVSAA